MPSKLYRVDNRRLTLRECWNQTRSANVLILWLLKLLRIRISLPPMPYPEAVHQLALDRDALPPTAVSRLDPLVVELESEGFHSPRYYRYASSRGRTEIFIAALIQSRGEAIARVMYVIGHESHPPLERTRVFILSVLSDGSWLVTSPQRAEFEPSPGVEVIRLLDAPPARLAQAHLEALNSRRAANPPIPVPTQEEAETVADRYERSCFDHGIRRGLYVPLTEAEEANEQEAVVAAEHAKAEVGSKHADVLVEIERLQNPKSSLKNALWILGVSLVAFVVLGGAKWEWEFVLLLIPILLFHEAGHWLAMRMFGYRNLRMFFIPLFGAAVSGQNFNVAGWKKALVSLAGPAPGLLLGVVLAIASLFAGPPWLEKFALLTVVLNAFNLLPFVPLDGGWFLNATVFCRRAWLETGFKLLAVVALVLASVQTGERLWGFLAILMALSLRTTWRIGRLAEQLRASGLPTQSLDRQTIPPDSLATLVSAVKGSTKQPRPVKIVASETLDLFERLNARPPGLLATLALLTAYVGTIILGFLGFGLASFARTSGLDLLDEDSVIAVDPPLTLTCDDTATATTEAAWPDPTNRVVLIGIHPDAETARSQWTELTNTWPSTVARVGSVLVAMYSKAAVDQIARARELLAPLGTNFIQKDSGDDPYVLLDLTCQLPLGLS
ncbi:MAG TPA: hypothetical protein DCE44_25990, partial [Verrucomicrobiales bacterium]|nr:hypothetical protein [Verrucomicrobiales bacterium]